MPYLLDTNVLIDYTRQNRAAADYIDTLPDWAVSQVTAMELIAGARDKRDLNDLDTFLAAYTVLPLSDAIGRRAYYLVKTYAKSHGLHVFDSLVAATALEEGLTLATKNRKHFFMIDGLDLDVPEY